MTVKEIALATSKLERSVHNWTKKVSVNNSQVSEKIAQAKQTSKPADYDLDETCAIIEIGLGKNAASMYKMNALQSQQTDTYRLPRQSTLTQYDIDLISKLTAGIVSQVMANMDNRVKTIENRIEERKALLPPPEMEVRQQLNMFIRSKQTQDKSIQTLWNELYTNFGYRTHSNLHLMAKNRGISVLDYVESEGQLEALLATAIEIFK